MPSTYRIKMTYHCTRPLLDSIQMYCYIPQMSTWQVLFNKSLTKVKMRPFLSCADTGSRGVYPTIYTCLRRSRREGLRRCVRIGGGMRRS